MNAKLLKKLKKGNKTWKKAQERSKTEGFDGATLDDGRYKTVLADCELNESQASNRLQVKFQFKITSGDSKDESIYMYQGVEDEDGQMYLDRILRKFGIAVPDDLSEIPALCDALKEAAPEVRVQLKTKDDNQYCYVDRLLSELNLKDFESHEEGDDDEGTEEDDDGSEEEGEIEVGSRVSFESKKYGELEGEVLELLEDDEKARVKADNGKTIRIATEKLTLIGEEEEEEAGEEEEPEGEEPEVDIEVGMKVAFEGKKGKILTGKITKLMEKEDKVKVKVGKKIFTLSVNDLSLPEND